MDRQAMIATLTLLGWEPVWTAGAWSYGARNPARKDAVRGIGDDAIGTYIPNIGGTWWDVHQEDWGNVQTANVQMIFDTVMSWHPR